MLAPEKPLNARPRDAASLILWRRSSAGVEVLMGLRHARHRFMPHAMVFPGGRVDPTDHRHPAVSDLLPETRGYLERRATPGRARALAIAAVRELHEETGLVLGDLRGGTVHADLAPLHYICRAITPPPRAIRFHARFLAAPAELAEGTLRGSGELEVLRFWPVEEAMAGGRMAGITAKVLAQFLHWLDLPDEHRLNRDVVVFRGRDTPIPDR